MCLSKIQKSLTKKNVFFYLIFGFRHNDKEVKEMCFKLIVAKFTRQGVNDKFRTMNWNDWLYYNETDLKETMHEALLDVLPQ